MTYKHKGRTYSVDCFSWKDCETKHDCMTNDNPYCKEVLKETLTSRFRNWLKNRGRG